MAGAVGRDPFAETEDQAALRQLARDVAEREVAPRAREHDESGEPPLEAAKALASADLLRVTVGEEWGGLGYGDVEASIVLEEVARADVSSAIWAQLTFNGPPRGIEHLGPPAMKERWLPEVANGEALISIGITEPDAGSAVQEMRTALKADGAGFRLDGYKNYSTLGHVAQGILVWCRWPGGEGAKGIGAVIVPMDRPGVSLTGVHHSMGVHAATEAEIAFDDVEIGPDDVLIAGDPAGTEAFKVLLAHLNHERCGNASMCVGAAQGALEHAVRYVNERVIGGKPLATLQGLQWKLADMAIALEGARLHLRRAVHLAGEGGTPPPLETAMAKAAANRAAKFVCDEAMQLLGGYGYSREYPLERTYRDIRGLCIGAGTIEAQLNYVGSNVVRGRASVSPGWIAPRSSDAVTLQPTWLHRDRAAAGPTLDAALSSAPGSVVDDRASLAPDAVADVVARLAGALRARGAQRGTTVVWQAANRWEGIALFRACWRLGAVAAPIHHLAGPAEVDGLLSRLGPSLVVDPDEVAGMAEAGEPVVTGAAAVAPEDLALVLHTSGSSGVPKGVLHTQAGLSFKAALMLQVHGLTADDVVLMPAPLAHISGLQNAVTVAGVGGMQAVLMAKWDPEHTLELIERHRVTFMMGPPTFFVTLRDTPGFSAERVRSLRLISCGGAGVTPAFVGETSEAFQSVVKRTYGSTEAPTVTTGYAGDDPERLRETDGRVTGDVRIRFGPSDELWVRGPELFVGYTDPARTAEAIGVDDEGAEWFRTGDVGRLDPDGWLTITGRIKDLIIRGGENISAAEVESTLEAHPAVRSAVAVGEPDQRLGEKVCAFVVCVPGSGFDLDGCRAWFADRGVTRFKTPERVVALDEMPLLAAGKIDRAALRQRAAELARA